MMWSYYSLTVSILDPNQTKHALSTRKNNQFLCHDHEILCTMNLYCVKRRVQEIIHLMGVIMYGQKAPRMILDHIVGVHQYHPISLFLSINITHSCTTMFIVLPWQHPVYKPGINERYFEVCDAFPYQTMNLSCNNEANKSPTP